MTAINCLLKDLEIKSCSDNWQPWRNIEEVVKKELRKEVLERTVSTKPNNKSKCEGNKCKLTMEGKAKQA